MTVRLRKEPKLDTISNVLRPTFSTNNVAMYEPISWIKATIIDDTIEERLDEASSNIFTE